VGDRILGSVMDDEAACSSLQRRMVGRQPGEMMSHPLER
jgi:hypothetical protein